MAENLGYGQWAWWGVLWEGTGTPTSSPQVLGRQAELSGHQREPVGDGDLRHGVLDADGQAGGGWWPAGDYGHKSVIIQVE